MELERIITAYDICKARGEIPNIENIKKIMKEQDEPIKLKIALIFFMIMALLLGVMCYGAFCEIPKKLAVKSIVGEISCGNYQEMLNIASAIRNRGTLQGVYGLKANRKEPKYVWTMAEKAWKKSELNRTHSGSFWGSKICDKNWIKEMERKGFEKTKEDRFHKFYREVK